MTDKPRSRHIPEAVARRLLEESRSRCCLCRVLIDPERDDPETLFDTLEKHHIILFSEGGEHTVENLLLVCANCHTKIHKHPEKYPIDKLRQAKQHWLSMVGVVPAELAISDELGDGIRVTFLLKSLNLRYPVVVPSQATVGELALFVGQKVMKPLGEYDHNGNWLYPERVDLNFEGRKGFLDRGLSLAAVPVQTGDVLTARITHVVEPVTLPPLPFLLGLGEDEAEEGGAGASAQESVAEPRLREVTPEPELVSEQPVWERHHPFEPEMVFVPAGAFWMGTDRRKLEAAGVEWWDWLKRELPQHRVRLPAYWIGKYPVTNAEYREFIEDGGYQAWAYWTDAGWAQKEKMSWRQPRYWGDEKYNSLQQPVAGVSWYEAVAYCRWLSARTRREYRLPSEAEWEKAARGTDGRIWPWGDKFDKSKCNVYESGIGKPTPVGKFSPQGDSPYGCADMAGNVLEWCATKWESRYEGYQGDDDLEGDARRVLRGGSFDLDARFARCAYRYDDLPHFDWLDYGFRVVVLAAPFSRHSAL